MVHYTWHATTSHKTDLKDVGGEDEKKVTYLVAIKETELWGGRESFIDEKKTELWIVKMAA